MTNMKLVFFSSVVSLFLSTMGIAQTFTWVTNDTIETNLALNTTVLLKMEQEAVGTDTVVLGIEVIYNDLPAAWDGMLCIEGVCLGIIPPVGTTETMLPISGAAHGYVRLTVNPLNGTETAKLQVYVYDVNFPNDGDTATWLLNTTLSIGDDLDIEKLSIYPNPVDNSLTVKSSHNFIKAQLYSLTGKLVDEFNLMQSSILDMKSIETGFYNLRLIDEKGDAVVRKIQKK